MRKGGPSINPSGRPKGAVGLAKYIASQTDDCKELVDRWIKMMRSGSDREALGAPTLLAAYAVGRPMSITELHVTGRVDVAAIMNLPPEARLAALDTARAQRALGVGELEDAEDDDAGEDEAP